MSVIQNRNLKWGKKTDLLMMFVKRFVHHHLYLKILVFSLLNRFPLVILVIFEGCFW